MKKTALIILVFAGFSFASMAQTENAIGLRFGGGSAFGGEISFQKALGDAKRLEFDLGWNDTKYYNRMSLAVIYQWVNNIDGGLNWYIGPAAVLGMYNHKNNDNDDHIGLGVGGQIGIEYNFNDAPFQISLDTRPTWGIVGSDFSKDLHWDVALGLRYTF